MQPGYENEFRERATADGWWVIQEGSGPEWEKARKKYQMTASAAGAMWNGAGYERTSQALARIVDGKQKVFDRYTQIMLDEGKAHEAEVIGGLVKLFWGYATWQLSPGIFEFKWFNTPIGASPDGILWFGRHQIPIEVKWHAKGECKIPMPSGYFAQLYVQMIATRACLGIYLGMAPNGESWCQVIQRKIKVDNAFEERFWWFLGEMAKFRTEKNVRYKDESRVLEAYRMSCTLLQQKGTEGLVEFLKATTKRFDDDGTTELFDVVRNAIPPTRVQTPTAPTSPPSPGLPLPEALRTPRSVGRSRSRSASPRERSVRKGSVGQGVVEGDEKVEGEEQ